MAARAGHEVRLWSRNADVVKSINETRVNSHYLSSTSIPSGVTATGDLGMAVHDAPIVIFAAPSHVARELLTAMSSLLDETAIIVSVSKGIEIESGKRISEIAKEVLGSSYSFVCLSGPSFAKEVVAGHPTAIVAASRDSVAARTVQNDLVLKTFASTRTQTSSGPRLAGRSRT